MHVIDSLAPGGSERMAIEIANATDKDKYRVTICVTRTETLLAQRIDPKIDLFVLGRRRRLDRAKFTQFLNYCQEKKVSLLHVHGWSSIQLVALLHLFFHDLWKLGLVFQDHYGDVEINPYHPALVRAAIRWLRPQYVGVHQRLSQNAIQMGLDEEKVSTIQNAIDFSNFQRKPATDSPAFNTDGKELKGIVVANVRPSKDILLLIQALAELHQRNLLVAVAGAHPDPGYYQACLALLHAHNLERHVQFLGKRLDVIDLICTSDFGILSSKTESGPLALIEYAAGALPFVSTRVGLVGNELHRREVPEFVEPGDAGGLALALNHLLGLSQDERLRRGAFGREIAAETFEIQAVMPAWYKVYGKALQDRRR